MLKKGEIKEIEIKSLAYGGEGIGKIDGITVFVADSSPGDIIKTEIISCKKSYARGKLIEVITPSPYRVKPFCGLANVCGGCQWQHIDYDFQLKAKKQIVEDSLKKIGGFNNDINIEVKDVISSPKKEKYRCKVQYPTGQTKVSKRFLAGYYKKGTHDIVNIKHCPVHPDVLNEITEFAREQLKESGLTAYNEDRHKGLLRHLVFRYSSSNKNVLLIFVLNSNEVPVELNKIAESIMKQFPEVVGVLANFNTSRSNVIMGGKTQLITGQDYIEENLEGRKFKISAGSFFQVNPESAVNIFNTVENIIKGKLDKPKILDPKILDVYAGVGNFAVWLKDIASEIVAIEEFQLAVEDAKENIILNQADNIKMIEGDAQVVLNELRADGAKFDVIILDPPRKGCTPESLDSAVNLSSKYIIYVSCNPTTLARDLKILNEKGFIPQFVQPVDMFCHTYHIESIAVLEKF